MKLSVGIVTKNRKTSLQETLDSLVVQKVKPLEVIIVENNPKKKLITLFKNYEKILNIKYFLVKKPGIAGCRNVVVKKSKSEITAFIDDDCVLPVDWCKKVTELFEDKKTVLVVGNSSNYYKKNPISILEQQIYFTWMSQYINPNKRVVLPSGMFVNTRNLAFRTDFVKKSNIRFNPNTPHKIEDTDFGIRLFSYAHKKGNNFIYDPDMVLFHKNSTNLTDFFKRKNLSTDGEKWLLKKYSGFKDIRIKDKNTYNKLMKKNVLAKILFSYEGFYNRQKVRINYFLKNKKILWKVNDY